MSEVKIYAGIDIGGTNVKYGLVDAQGNILFKEQRPTVADKGPEPLLHLVANIGERLLLVAAEEEREVPWLGIGTPGSIDFRSGTVTGYSPNIPGWLGTSIGDFMRDRLNLPVYVDNDVNVVALAEHRFGAGIGHSSVVCVAIGTGVGGGLIINNRVWRGGTHGAGEIGHMIIDPDGPSCRCGRKGCLEAFCSSAAIITRCKGKLKGGLTPAFEELLNGDLESLTIKKLFAAARKRDDLAREVIVETADYLALGLANVLNLLNPDLVIIGGGIADGGAGFVEEVARNLHARVDGTAVGQTKVVKATLGNSAGFIGAGILGDER
jgi:glucokinase